MKFKNHFDHKILLNTFYLFNDCYSTVFFFYYLADVQILKCIKLFFIIYI